MIKAVKTIENKHKAIMNALETELQDADIQLEKLMEALRTKEEEMKAASARVDIVQYKALKAEYEDLRTHIEMYENRKKNIDTEPYISKEEYESLMSNLEAEAKACEEKTRQELCNLSVKIEELRQAFKKDVEDINKAMTVLQSNLYKDKDRLIYANGIIAPHDKKVFSPRDTFYWFDAILMNHQYAVETQKMGATEQE